MMGSLMAGSPPSLNSPPNDLNADAMPVGEEEPNVEAIGPVIEDTGYGENLFEAFRRSEIKLVAWLL